MTSNGTYALKIINLSKKFGSLTALDNINLDVSQGETFGLLGPNGAGKSTLINIISGVLSYDSGTLEYFGELRSRPTLESRRSLGVIPQEISLYDKLTARENLEFYGRLYDVTGPALKKKISEVLNLVGLADRQSDYIGTYSGGMKRRINIACSILHSPKFILMDEPTVGIDPQSRNLIFEVIEKLHTEGTTILYTSHYMEEVERLCHKVTIIDGGRVIAGGTKEELISLIGGIDTVVIDLVELTEPLREAVKMEFPDMHPAFIENSVVLNTAKGSEKLGGLVTWITSRGARISKIQVREPNLENVFLHLTGKGLRD